MKKQVGFWITLSISIILIVTGFFVPPMGIIDGSVITAVGELLGFGALSMIPEIIKSAKSAKVTTMGGTTIEVHGSQSQVEMA